MPWRLHEPQHTCWVCHAKFGVPCVDVTHAWGPVKTGSCLQSRILAQCSTQHSDSMSLLFCFKTQNLVDETSPGACVPGSLIDGNSTK
eukprot:1161658-Pelagomonas_calceolata.AAC.8